jgi:hypothetical protein
MHTRPRRDGTKQPGRSKPEPRKEIPPDENNHPDDPEVTLDDLRHAIARVEALAHATNRSITDIPFIPNPTHRPRVSRLFLLIEETALAATLALSTAEALIEKTTTKKAAPAESAPSSGRDR